MNIPLEWYTEMEGCIVFTYAKLHICYLKNWVCLMVDVEPKRTTKLMIERRKDLLFTAGKENTGHLSQSTVSHQSPRLVWLKSGVSEEIISTPSVQQVWWLRLRAHRHRWNRTELYNWIFIFDVVTSLAWLQFVLLFPLDHYSWDPLKGKPSSQA